MKECVNPCVSECVSGGLKPVVVGLGLAGGISGVLRQRLQREGRPLCTRGVLGPCWMKGECWLALENEMLSSEALVLILRASCRALESYEGGAFLSCFLKKKIGLITYRR